MVIVLVVVGTLSLVAWVAAAGGFDRSRGSRRVVRRAPRTERIVERPVERERIVERPVEDNPPGT